MSNQTLNVNNTANSSDERVRTIPLFRKLLARPESSAVSGTVLILIIFLLTASDSGMFSAEGIINWTTVAAYLGIVAVGAALLMIGGEFDLSVGSMIGFGGMAFAIPVLYWGWPAWAACLFALAIGLLIGYVNGKLVTRTGLPSFIVTLAFYYILRGLTLAFSTYFTGQTIISTSPDGVSLSHFIKNDWFMQTFFQGYSFTGLFNYLAHLGWIAAGDNGTALSIGIPKVILWWLVITAIGAFVLARTRFGNAVQAIGGDANAAKNMGIPVKRYKIFLFMLMAFCSVLFALLQVSDAGSAAADRGLQKEFEAIIAAVIGGCLLTGGFGSVIGAAFGAIIFGMVQIGIGYTDIDSNLYRVFLGGMLLIAVLFNNYVRRKVTFAKH